MELDIRGFMPLSLVDYPDNIASVVFFGRCNMACPFCYNEGLVRTPEKYDRLAPEAILAELTKRRKLLDGVVLSGGEPTLYAEALPGFIKQIKALGLLVKLDTNGLNPDALEALLPLVDYVAMDVKAAKQRYRDATGVGADIALIRRSISLLKASGKGYELRTTVVPAFIPEEDFDGLVSLVEGADAYYIQQYRPVRKTGLLSKAYEPSVLRKLAEIAGKRVKKVSIRGI